MAPGKRLMREDKRKLNRGQFLRWVFGSIEVGS